MSLIHLPSSLSPLPVLYSPPSPRLTTRLGPTLPNHADLLASFKSNLRYLVVADRCSFGRLELNNLRDFRNLKLLVLPHTRYISFATTELNTDPSKARRQWYENAMKAKLREYWNSPPTILYHRSSSGRFIGRSPRR